MLYEEDHWSTMSWLLEQRCKTLPGLRAVCELNDVRSWGCTLTCIPRGGRLRGGQTVSLTAHDLEEI